MELKTRKWSETSFVAFDLETSGAFPVGSEIIEFGAVKWRDGKIIDQMEMLFSTRAPLSDFNMSIHGITNEMIADKPRAVTAVAKISDFIKDNVLMAHHAPFDLGFLVYEFEKVKLEFPCSDLLCTSLLSRNIIPESSNHKLQTLIGFLKLNRGQAHRGLDDAIACLEVGLECFRRTGENTTISELKTHQRKKLEVAGFRLTGQVNAWVDEIIRACEQGRHVDFEYDGGSLKGIRRALPQGIVRNPDGDYFQAICNTDSVSKRFYFDKIKSLQTAFP